ncbi:unnamed protein product [Peronospora destructor]|uniref:Lon protease homolog n=1 Tax=Peronospora destructor TaxID=86335 RepID=A0AAV0U0Z1_9STRA|nr:unnamed protein product [Peronospora destructor]
MVTALRRFMMTRPRPQMTAATTLRFQRAPVLAAQYICPNPFAFRSAVYTTDSNGRDDKKNVTNDDVNKDKADSVEVVINNDLATVGEGDNAPTYPHVLVMPAHRRPFFPGVVLPMTITNPEVTRALIALKESGQKYVGVFLKKSSGDPLKSGGGEDPVKNLSEIHHVGSFARIDNMLPFDANSVQILMVSQRRIAIENIRDEGPPLRVNINNLDNPSFDPKSKLIRAYSNEIVATLREIVKMNPLFKDHMQYFSQRINIHNPYKLADFAASVTSADGEELQQVMEEMSCEARLKKALELITKELELSKVQQTIKEQVEEKVSKNQRNYLLMEQLKAIKKELGMEKDDKDAMITKYRERLAEFKSGSIPDNVIEVVEDELNKMSMLEKNSSEFNVTRNYLDWLTQLPWGKATEENFDLAKAKQILDEDHYGLKDIKERILEFIAVSKLKGDVQGKIICFVGPPGVGKTSIGKSIARSLNREFFRFSVGGLSDVAEIKGHRRTYIGAMPGKIIQCLKSTQSSNPLILIDEIDKLGRGYQGDPASALLELLDPSQNSGFVDHYMDVPVDLSRVLFICTANVTDTIPGPLLDRMEILRLSGYDSPEKLAIAKEYLVPKALEKTGLQKSETTPGPLGLTDDAILTLVKQYCRENGVRNLEKHVEKVFRKIALEVVKDIESSKTAETQQAGESTSASMAREDLLEDQDRFVITPEKLSKYVGKPIFTSDRIFEKQFPGVVMGLAWTAMGGASLYIETTKVHTKGDRSGLITTGQMGSVMEESTKIAHTFARSKMHAIDSENKFFEENEVHLHVPEGATPKDGPSAGCTMVTALLSLAMNKNVKPDLAMTGELSLVGKVLPVGGIKEKIIAAKRSGVKTLILPLGNKRDFDELEEYLRFVYGALHKTSPSGLTGLHHPAVWKARSGFLDCDANLHLNNSSYLYNMELARWHLTAANGALWQAMKHRRMFLVASQAVRFRHSILPFQAYEIKTQMVYWDGPWIFFLHQFQDSSNGKQFAEGLCRVKVKQHGEDVSFQKIIFEIYDGPIPSQPAEMPDIVKGFLEWDAASRSSMETAHESMKAKIRSNPLPPKPEKLGARIWMEMQRSMNRP